MQAFLPSAKANDGEVHTVGVDQLVMYETASDQSPIVGHLKRGDRVPIFKESNGWVQTYYNNAPVWVAKHLLIQPELNIVDKNSRQTNQSTPSKKSTVRIADDGVHLRSGPGTDYAILDLATIGQKLPLLDTVGDWHKVTLPNGKSGWVAAWLTDKTVKQDKVADVAVSKRQLPNDSLKGYNIMLDAGHGGFDPGNIAVDGTFEKDFNLKITKVIAETLRNYGATVTLTRSDDRYLSVQERIEINEQYWTDAFISIHFNAFTNRNANGISTHYFHAKDSALAKSIQEKLAYRTNLSNRGVIQDNFFVLSENDDPAVLLELGFLTNQSDFKQIKNKGFEQQVAKAVAEGLVDYFK